MWIYSHAVSFQKRRGTYIYVTVRRVRATKVAEKKTISVTHSECMFVALVIQHGICTRHSVICDLPGSTIFSQISHKRYHFCDKVIVNKMRVLIFSTTFEIFLMFNFCLTVHH
jgi:hypothetical protein